MMPGIKPAAVNISVIEVPDTTPPSKYERIDGGMITL